MAFVTTESEQTVKTVTIAAGATGLSAEVDIEGFNLFGIEIPSTWVTANITFQVARASGGTFQTLFDDAGNVVMVTVAAVSTTVSCDNAALKLAPYRYIKLCSSTVSGTTVTAVNQTGAPTLYLICKG